MGKRIRTDGQGNAFVAADFGGAVDVGNGPLTCTSTSGGSLLAKLSPSGTALWSKALCSDEDVSVLGLAVDAAGDSIVTGWFEGTLDFGGTSLTAMTEDVYVAKYDPSGTLLWAKHYGGGGVENWGTDVAVAASGRIGLTGFFYDTIDFGGGPLTVSGTSHDIFVTELGSDGSLVFAKGFGSSGQNTGDGVAFDAAGNIFVTGLFEGPADFGNGTLTPSGGFDAIFLAKLDPTGKSLWSQGFSGSVDNSTLEPFGVAVDGAGNVVMDGVYAGAASFGGANDQQRRGRRRPLPGQVGRRRQLAVHQELRRRLQPVRLRRPSRSTRPATSSSPASSTGPSTSAEDPSSTPDSTTSTWPSSIPTATTSGACAPATRSTKGATGWRRIPPGTCGPPAT